MGSTISCIQQITRIFGVLLKWLFGKQHPESAALLLTCLFQLAAWTLWKFNMDITNMYFWKRCHGNFAYWPKFQECTCILPSKHVPVAFFCPSDLFQLSRPPGEISAVFHLEQNIAKPWNPNDHNQIVDKFNRIQTKNEGHFPSNHPHFDTRLLYLMIIPNTNWVCIRLS